MLIQKYQVLIIVNELGKEIYYIQKEILITDKYNETNSISLM